MKRANNFIDLAGRVYGYLTVSGIAESRDGLVRWNCLCKCGKRTIVPGQRLRDGKTKSCGCLRASPRVTGSESGFRGLYSNIRNNAHQRGHDFALTADEVRKLTKAPCHYCGIAPCQVWKPTRKNKVEEGAYFYNGIDRLDSNKGYVIDNVVTCCGVCNTAKNDLPLKCFLDWLKRAYEWNFKSSSTSETAEPPKS